MIYRFLLMVLAACLWAAPSFAADPFTIAGVHVDAQAGTALEAQTLAIKDGQLRAANMLIERMSTEQDRAVKGFLGVSQGDSDKMIRALEVANEKRSASRYLSDITVAFNPAAVSQYMRAHNLTLITSQSRKRLVIPVLQGGQMWGDNEWTQAWQDGSFEHSLTPMQAITPRPAVAGLLSTIDGANISMQNLKAIGRAYGVEQILIASASQGYMGYTVTVKDVAIDSEIARSFGPFTAPSASEAVSAAVMAIEKNWKATAVSTASSESIVMSVSVLYRNHAEWRRLQDVINGSSQIRSAELVALSKGGAMMTFTYGGDIERMRVELAYKGVSLRTDPNMGTVIYQSGAF